MALRKSSIFLAAGIFIAAGSHVEARRYAGSNISYDKHGFTQQSTHSDARHSSRNYRQVRRGSGFHHIRVASARHEIVLGGRPIGCPRRYCGCGASLKVFGRIRPELNLASNWLKYFPRTSAAPGMAAARRGHVMVLLADHGSLWLVYDANSGSGLTRIHERSLRGFSVVNPYASRVAGI